MNNSENKKSFEQLADEALENVAGGSEEGVVIYGGLSALGQFDKFFRQFKSNSNCDDCRLNWDCTILDMDDEEFYAMFGGNPNAKCPNFKS